MKNKRKQIIWRYGVVSMVITTLAILIVYNALSTTVIHAGEWNKKARRYLDTIVVVPPTRGEILACDGSVLATNLTKYTLRIDYHANAPRTKDFIASLDSLCDTLALHYPVRDKDQWKQYLSEPLSVAPEKRKTNHLLLKKITYDEYQKVLDYPFFRRYGSRYKSGLTAEETVVREYPYGNMARRSIGRCNIKDNEVHGYSGLEYALDSLLFGKPGTARKVQLTRKIDDWVDTPATDGYTIRTTIDINMQDIVENELQAMLQHTEGKWGTAILMEVSTGDIKAISNLDRDSAGNYIEAMNYALQAYEPGSVMKPISMIVALEDGYAFPLERTISIEGGGYRYAGGSPIRDTHSPSYLPVSRIIEYSSNIGMTKLIAPHYEKDYNGFRERLREIGLFDRLNTGLAGERTPYFPTLYKDYGPLVSLSRMTYGYSTMIPPLYTCAIYNAIANDGRFVRPRMVKSLISDTEEKEMPVTYVRDSICSKKNAMILREMLHSVIYGQGGTAKSLKSDIVDIAGKTGTCKIAIETPKDSIKDKSGKSQQVKGYREGHYRLAFCGFFPYDKPLYTCMVVISDPAPQFRGAATTSGMVLKNIALKMYARGMLDNTSDYSAEANDGTHPTLYATYDNGKVETLKSVLNSRSVSRFTTPETHNDGTVPNVKGLGLREAVAMIEKAGYSAAISGSGYAISQYPAPGTVLKPGDKINVSFTNK